MQDDKIYVVRLKNGANDFLAKISTFVVAFTGEGQKVTTEILIEVFGYMAKLELLESYLFQKYGVEFIRELKNLYNKKLEGVVTK